MDEVIVVEERMKRQGLGTALRHLRLAKGALDRHEWESSNSQIRASLESLFNSIAQIRLASSKTGGEARKELEAQGVLREPEARLVQHFFRTAGGAGAHAGISNEDEARGRFMIGLGVCYLGLALIPELIRVEDVLVELSQHPQAIVSFATDAEMRTSCPSCGRDQALAECEIKRSGDHTVYLCHNGCQVLIVVGSDPESSWTERGATFGPYEVRNVAEITMPCYAKDKREHVGDIEWFAHREALMDREPTVREAARSRYPDQPLIHIDDFILGRVPSKGADKPDADDVQS